MGLYLGATELSTGGGGGGGGFTKMNKYSTFRALDDATQKVKPSLSGTTDQNKTTGATTMQFQGGSIGSSSTNSFTNVLNSMSGYKFTHNSTEHTITANPAFNYGFNVVFTFTPALTANLNANVAISFTTPLLTVNPATDLSLSDGDQIGYMLVGGGATPTADNSYFGGTGGFVLLGTAEITNASTDLVLIIGEGYDNSTNTTSDPSTITGGLTLTSANGSDQMGWPASRSGHTAGPGVNGYGAGGPMRIIDGNLPSGGAAADGQSGTPRAHGFGGGGYTSYPHNEENSNDGAILIFY